MGLETFTLGMEGQHADKTTRSIEILFWDFENEGASGAIETFDSDSSDIPESWSWVDHGVITKVKDQGDCGSYVYLCSFTKKTHAHSNRCWAFSTAAAMEAAFNKENSGSIPKECTDVCGK